MKKLCILLVLITYHYTDYTIPVSHGYSASQEIPHILHECSLMCLQELNTGPHPEPDESSPHFPILEWYLRILLETTVR